MDDTSDRGKVLDFKAPPQEEQHVSLMFTEDLWDDVDPDVLASLTQEQIEVIESALFHDLFCGPASNDNLGGIF